MKCAQILESVQLFGHCLYFPVNIYSCKQRNRCNKTVPTKKYQVLPRPFLSFYSTNQTKHTCLYIPCKKDSMAENWWSMAKYHLFTKGSAFRLLYFSVLILSLFWAYSELIFSLVWACFELILKTKKGFNGRKLFTK